MWVAAGCPRCDGALTKGADRTEKLRCLQCGWRNYVDKFPREGRRASHLKLPYLGQLPVERRVLVTQIISGASASGSLRVLCPYCNPGAVAMNGRLESSDHLICDRGHLVVLKRRGRELVGWH